MTGTFFLFGLSGPKCGRILGVHVSSLAGGKVYFGLASQQRRRSVAFWQKSDKIAGFLMAAGRPSARPPTETK
jgi:hypothetical protein